jgi:hypothetical protein
MVIYEITNNINGKIYIGKDVFNKKTYYGSGVLIKRAIKKYGKDNFSKKIIDTANSYEELSKKEVYWINKYRETNDLYNITKGGDGGDTLSTHPDIEKIKIKISNSSKTKGSTYEDVYGHEKSKIYKEKLKEKLHLSLNGETAKQKRKQYWVEYWNNYKEKCFTIKKKLKECSIEEVSDDLILLYKSIPNKNNIMNFNNVKGFYDFFNDNRVDELFNRKLKRNKICLNCKQEFVYNSKDEIYCSKKCVIRKGNPNYYCLHKKSVSIDGVIYESITESSKKLSMDRSLIRYRLKSNNYENYYVI